MSSALDRILADAGTPLLLEVLADRLNPTDLQSLLLAVYARRSRSRTPAKLLADYEHSRFFGAAQFCRADFAEWEQVTDAATAGRFEVLTLSPMTPLATCAAIANVGQDWSIPTIRTGEVASDPTNILALEAALRHKKHPSADEVLHLAATQRVVRPQAYANSQLLSHFALFALLSSGRDTGGYEIEASSCAIHVHTHLSALRQFLGTSLPLSVSFTIENRSTDDARLRALHQATARHGVPLWEESDRSAARQYYRGFCFHIWAELTDQRQQLADGGAVDWVAKLTSNRKERTLISGCGVEGILSLRQRTSQPG
jgi:hypothetical protein